MNEEALQREKQAYADDGELATYYREYESTFRPQEGVPFLREYFIYEPAHPKDFVHKAICVDPSISKSETADYCAFAVMGQKENGQVYLFHCDGHKGLDIAEQSEMYFQLRRTYGVGHPIVHNGVESQAYQLALAQTIRNDMFRQKDYFVIEEIKHSSLQKKEPRIKGLLQPMYKNGFMRHVRRFFLLEEQLLDFPLGKVDLPDVCAMCLSMLQPYAAYHSETEKDLIDLEEDEYEVLDIEFGRMCP